MFGSLEHGQLQFELYRRSRRTASANLAVRVFELDTRSRASTALNEKTLGMSDRKLNIGEEPYAVSGADSTLAIVMVNAFVFEFSFSFSLTRHRWYKSFLQSNPPQPRIRL